MKGRTINVKAGGFSSNRNEAQVSFASALGASGLLRLCRWPAAGGCWWLIVAGLSFTAVPAVSQVSELTSPSVLKLLPAPWVDGEILDFSMTMGNMPAGAVKMRYSVHSSKTNPANWNLETRMYNPVSMFITQVEAERETMKPVLSRSSNPMLPSQTSYYAAEARIEVNGKDPKTVKLDGPVFDVNELVGVLRRLPLTTGYKSSLQLLASPNPNVTWTSVEVAGEEDVKTPAGQFHAYRVEVNATATYWISNDEHRYLVKFEQGAMMTSELLAILRADDHLGVYRNGELGFSLSVPAGWTVEETSIGPVSKDKRMVQLVDSDSSAIVTLTVELSQLKTAPTVEGMRKEAMRNAGQPSFPPQKMRVDSLQDRQVGGNPALGWIADATGPLDKSPLVAYTVWVRSAALKVEFSAKVDPKDFVALQPHLDGIINSLTLR
jgi:Protein of unknown function (DUF3108)